MFDDFFHQGRAGGAMSPPPHVGGYYAYTSERVNFRVRAGFLCVRIPQCALAGRPAFMGTIVSEGVGHLRGDPQDCGKKFWVK